MYNITIVATRHTELGKCNSDELYKIIESISPEVIFDELPGHAFDIYFSDSFDIYYTNSILLNRHPPEVPLEVKCIKKYRQNYNIKICPVDIDVRQKLSKYQDEISFLFFTFLNYEDYERLDNENDVLIAQEGFRYLNSDKFWDFIVKKEVIVKNIIESDIQKDRLLNIYKIFHAEHYDNRENAMLQSIYNYSKENHYNQAVFLIGAEHKRSIMQKITDFENRSGIKLNWTMYGTKY